MYGKRILRSVMLCFLAIGLNFGFPELQPPAFAAGPICGSFTWLKAKLIVNPQNPTQQQGTFAFDRTGFREAGSNTLYILGKNDGIAEGKIYRIHDPIVVTATTAEKQSLAISVGLKITGWSRLDQVSSCSAQTQPPPVVQPPKPPVQQQQQQQQNQSPQEQQSNQQRHVPRGYVMVWADPETIDEGECAVIRWESEGLFALLKQGSTDFQPPVGSYQVCPTRDTPYITGVVYPDGSREVLTVWVKVRQKLPPPPKDVTVWVSKPSATLGEQYTICYTTPAASQIGLLEIREDGTSRSFENYEPEAGSSCINFVAKPPIGLTTYTVIATTSGRVIGTSKTSVQIIRPIVESVPTPILPLINNAANPDWKEGQIVNYCPAAPPESKSLFDRLFSVYAKEKNPFDEGQCTWYVFSQRPDVASWLEPYGNDAWKWAELAEKKGGLKVDKNPKPGDIAVWGPNCGQGVGEDGHVALVTKFNPTNEKPLTVNESNKNNDKTTYEGSTYRILDCMKFIHQPEVVPPKPVPTPEPKPQCLEIFGFRLWCPPRGGGGSW